MKNLRGIIACALAVAIVIASVSFFEYSTMVSIIGSLAVYSVAGAVVGAVIAFVSGGANARLKGNNLNTTPLNGTHW